jgi:hypothetical protein
VRLDAARARHERDRVEVGVVVAAGGWTSVWTWRHRAGRAHHLAQLLIVWGAVLAAIEVLPRVGYATPTAAHPAIWACQ